MGTQVLQDGFISKASVEFNVIGITVERFGRGWCHYQCARTERNNMCFMSQYKELLFTKYLVLPQGQKYRVPSDTLSTIWLLKHDEVSDSVVRYFQVLLLFEQPKSKTT